MEGGVEVEVEEEEDEDVVDMNESILGYLYLYMH